MTTFEVETSGSMAATPEHLHSGHSVPPQVEHRRAIHHAGFETQSHALPRRQFAQRGIGVRDGPLVGRDHVHVAP